MEKVELRLLNKDFYDVAILDNFISLSWADRYNESGDFQLVLPLTKNLVEMFHRDYYIWKDNTEHLMIVEDIEIDESNESQNKLMISGRSLESILDRRIIWNKVEYKDAIFQNVIKELINNSIINPSDTNRKISNFIFKESADTNITSLIYTGEHLGESVYSVIQQMCSDKKVGFKITLDNSNNFIFELYLGTDRSTEQTINMPVVFSDEYDNLFNSKYLETYKEYKNVCLFHGKDNHAGVSGSSKGVERREMYETDSNVESTDTKILNAKASEYLDKKAVDKVVDGDIMVESIYTYRKDYFIGDWITFRNQWGKESKSRITEMVLSYDTNGIKLSPSFTAKREEEK